MTQKLFPGKEIKISSYDVIHEKWNWEGIRAESYIFVTEDIKHISEEELKKMVVNSGGWDFKSEILIKETDAGFTFVNFNFK